MTLNFHPNLTKLLLCLATLIVSGCSTPEQLVQKNVPDKSVPIYYTAFWPRGPNSVGGFDVYQQFINPGQKVYKYVVTGYTAQNRVFDTVASEIDRSTVAGTKAIGPYPYGAMTDFVLFGPLWYNASIACVTLVRVQITYMDGTETVIEGADLQKVVAKGQTRRCS